MSVYVWRCEGACDDSMGSMGAGTGMRLVRRRDLVVIPLASLQDDGWDPRSIARGVAAGWGSLLRHVSRGTLVSLSGFALSLSRNLDRLASSEAVHLPVRRLATPSASPAAAASAASDAAAQASASSWGLGSMLWGVGRSVVGLVTRPVSGAMAVVSSTSQSILSATGIGDERARVGRGLWLRAFPDDELFVRWKALDASDAYMVHARATMVLGGAGSSGDGGGGGGGGRQFGEERAVLLVVCAGDVRVLDAASARTLQRGPPGAIVGVHESPASRGLLVLRWRSQLSGGAEVVASHSFLMDAAVRTRVAVALRARLDAPPSPARGGAARTHGAL